ncbi:cytochrome c oxidase assembly protein [Geotalea uraniireducens]|uniref:Cytochrome c oxidase assembly protein n=1 Tax=Geotalea uraniireducens TaxID=351604 RepID=A0ABM8EM77_9BACT|nr:cytochrome d ubiquinol oxidase subunit II [Geotalea uraniireducens]BDV43333.1 cytochrome c oxidase assembly protein [Geotalea uraniireducens]
MELQIIWFVLWGVLWAVYFMLDGFVLGAGVLHNILGRGDGEKRVLINTIGPVWDGNEVWLVTAGGATFAAFPTTYALMFSYLYTALLLLLFSLIVRGVSYEFRGKIDSDGWKKVWDVAIQVSCFLPALLFGVAFGNIFEGLPMDAAGYHGSLLSLLNPYGLLTGVLFVLLFVVHGALYVSVKTVGDLSNRAKNLADKVWPALLVVAVAFLAYTKFATKLFDNYLATPVLFVVPLVAVAALLGTRLFSAKGSTLAAFAASCVTVLTVVATGVVGLFPNLIPSSIDPNFSLTIYNSSSSPYTLKLMTVVAFIFVPIVILYKIWVYRIFRAPVVEEDVVKDTHAY